MLVWNVEKGEDRVMRLFVSQSKEFGLYPVGNGVP